MQKPKKKRKGLRIILFLLLALIIAAVLYFVYAPMKALEVVIPDLKGITQVNAKLKGDSVLAEINFIFRNKSPFKIKVDTLHYEIRLAGELLIEESVSVDLAQIKGQIDTLQLPINASIKTFRAVLEKLSDQDSTELQLNSYVVATTFFGQVKIPIEKTERIAVPVPPKINVIGVTHKRYHLREKTITAVVKIEIINKSKVLDLSIKDIHYKLVVKKNLTSEGTIEKKLDIKPGTTEYLEIPVVVELDKPFRTLIAVARDKDRFPYTLHLTCLLRENMMREGHEMPLEINASGMMELKD